MTQNSASGRLILTFSTLHQVLAAERALRDSGDDELRCRPTPTPPGLSQSICGMAIELLVSAKRDKAVQFLEAQQLAPSGTHFLPE